MSVELPRECRRLLVRQDGVLAIGQAIEAGMTAESIRNHLRAGRWQVMHRGVYAAFNGTATRRAELWGALLRAGSDAVLSHQTAAELYGLQSERSRLIHLTVPHDSNPERRGRIPGVVIHRSRSLARTRHPVLTPPRTRVEETVLDLIECARDFDEAYAWICRAIGRRLTTADRILAASKARLGSAGGMTSNSRSATPGAAPFPGLSCVTCAESRARMACRRRAAGSDQAGNRQPLPGQPLRGVPSLPGDRRNRRPPGG